VLNQVIAAAIATLVMAEISYRLVEQPALAWGKRFRSSEQIPSFLPLLRRVVIGRPRATPSGIEATEAALPTR
jgi:peptidoglycan/LPS O-acetylase OafA/YrhL